MPQENNRLHLVSFPLVRVYALSTTIGRHFGQDIEPLLGEQTMSEVWSYIANGFVAPAEYELIKPLGTFELTPKLIKDDAMFAQYVPEQCFPGQKFMQAEAAARDLKKLARAFGVSRKERSDASQKEKILNITLNLIASQLIDPTEEPSTWDGEKWSQYLRDHPHAPRQSVILYAIKGVKGKFTNTMLGRKLAAVIGGSYLHEVSVIVTGIGSDDGTNDGHEDDDESDPSVGEETE